MDIPRPAFAKARRRRRIWGMVAATVVLALITYLISRLEPAAPSVEGGPLYRDVVKRGPMLRAVRGPGTLVPEKIQYVQADTDGRVERILVLPGAEVQAETIIMELSNPELKQAAFDVEWQIKAAEAQFVRLKVQLESDRLSQEAVAATLKAEHTQALLEALADEELAKDGLVAGLTAKRSRAKADELGIRSEIEKKRISISSESVEAQLDVQRAELEKLRASFALKQRQVEGLRVRAGIDGVLQQIGDRETLQAGQRISPSATLAKIVQPSKLKAEIKISETQAKDLMLGQVALIDTRNGVVPGHVVRIDPASQNGTRTVDVALDGALPRGAVPELSVDGTIELERLHDVIYVGRPATPVEPGSTISLFKVIEAGKYAVRIPVKLGRSSVTTIEVLEGLQPGDTIILSDMSSVDGHDRIRLN